MSNDGFGPRFRATFRLALPVMLSQLGHVMVSVADSVMVGRVGPTPLAAATLANIFIQLTLVFGLGVSFGLTPLVARAYGAGQVDAPRVYLRHSLVINTVIALLSLVLVLVAGRLLHYAGQPREVVELALPYLNIITFSFLPLMLFQTYKQFAEGLEATRVAMLIAVGSNLLNIGLNYLLIYGNWGLPALGLDGAGYASLIARCLMAAIMLWYISRASRFRVYLQGSERVTLNRAGFRSLLALGVPAGLQFVFELSAFAIAVLMMGWLGTVALAAHQIGMNLASISYMMASGVSAAATVKIGVALGRQDYGEMRRLGHVLYTMVVLLMGSCALVFIVGRQVLPTLYIDDPAVIALAMKLLVVAALFQVSDGIQVVSLGALRGLGDVRVPTVMTFVSYWLLALPVAYLFGFVFGLGAIGVWLGLLTGLTSVAVILSRRFFQLVGERVTRSGQADGGALS